MSAAASTLLNHGTLEKQIAADVRQRNEVIICAAPFKSELQEKRGTIMFNNWSHTFTLRVIAIGELVKCKHGVDHPVSGNLKH